MPQVRQRYPTTDERALIGESLAGLFVVETLLQEPALFNSYIALDPSLWWNRGAMLAGAARQLPAVTRAQPHVFLASSGQPELAASAARLAALLQHASPSPLVKYLPLPEETHATLYHPAAMQALRTLFRHHRRPRPDRTGTGLHAMQGCGSGAMRCAARNGRVWMQRVRGWSMAACLAMSSCAMSVAPPATQNEAKARPPLCRAWCCRIPKRCACTIRWAAIIRSG